MAELIDKGVALKLFDNCGLSMSRTFVKNRISNMPTTTEAEIRNKAIDDFFDELERYENDGWLKLKMSSIYEIADQLKEE